MYKNFGGYVSVALDAKNSNSIGVDGELVEITEESIVLVSDGKKIVIPRENVLYFVIQEEKVDDIQQEPEPEKKENLGSFLNVYVNNELVSCIPLPPTFNVNEWSEDIYKVAVGSPDVQNELIGKKQKAIEFYPGKLYIIVESDSDCTTPGASTVPNSFSMGGPGSPTTQFLNPSQMVARLQNTSKKIGDDNGKQ